MLRAFVPFRVLFNQPLTRAIALLGSALSFTLTLRFCQSHWSEGQSLLIAMGLLWELAKLHLASQGIRLVHQERGFLPKLGGVSLITLAFLLAAGSVAASIGWLHQTDIQDRRQTLIASRAYNSALTDLQSLDEQIATLTSTAARDAAAGFRKRSLDTTAAINGLRHQRIQAATAVQALESEGAAGADAVSSMHDTAHLRLLVHAAVAVVLELIAVAAMVLLEHSRTSKAPNPTPRRRQSPASTATPRPERTPPPTSPRPHTRRLQFRIGDRLQAQLDQLPSRRRAACIELVRAIGDYALRIADTDGTITEPQLRRLSVSRSWRLTEGYLSVLQDVGALYRQGEIYTLPYFLDANPSVTARAAYANEQRQQDRSRKQRERSRQRGESTPNQQMFTQKNQDNSITCDPCHAEPTTTHKDDATAAPHPATTHAKQPAAPEMPWSRYLTNRDTADLLLDDGPAAPSRPEAAPRVARGKHRCVAAHIRDDGEALNLGVVVDALRRQGIKDRPELAEETFRQLKRLGITQAQIRYANHCLAVRRRKVEVENPLAYWLAIAKYQQGEALGRLAA